MQTNESSGQKSHALRRMLFRDAQQRTQIQRKPPHTLLQHRAQKIRFEGERTHRGAKAIEGVIAAIVVFLKPTGQSGNRLPDLLLDRAALPLDRSLLTSKCRRSYHSYFLSLDAKSGQSPPAPARAATAPARG